jgi:hypothetical protein
MKKIEPSNDKFVVDFYENKPRNAYFYRRRWLDSTI